MMTTFAALFDGVNFFNACFYVFLTGAIAGSIANFVVRSKIGCIFGNFFLGIVGAMIANFLIGLVPQGKDARFSFFATTVIATIAATLIAFVFHEARRAESKHQQNLLNRPQ